MHITPIELLGEGYPLPTLDAQKDLTQVWKLAFEIHKQQHVFVYPITVYNPWQPDIIDPIYKIEPDQGSGLNKYCDCFLRAYLTIKLGVILEDTVHKPTLHKLIYNIKGRPTNKPPELDILCEEREV